MSFKIPNEADAGFADQAEPDSVDFDILAAIHDKDGVFDGCDVTEDSPTGLFVAVASGTVMVDGEKASVSQVDVAITTGDGSNDRFDLVVVSNAGAVSVVDGTAAANPVFPAIPAQRVVLAAVFVPQSDTDIVNNQIIDKRMLIREIQTTTATYFVYDDGGTYRAIEGATGAVIDQGTDAAAVIRSVIGSNRKIVLGEGTFNLTSLAGSTDALDFGTGSDNCTIMGQGAEATILQIGVASWRSVIRCDSSDYFTIRDLTIDGNKSSFAGSPGIGVRLLSSSQNYVWIERVRVINCDDRAMSVSANNVWVERCDIGPSDGGLGFNSGSLHIRCIDNEIHDIGTRWTDIKDGIFFGGQYGSFIGNTIYTISDTGINLGGSSEPTGWTRVFGNLIYDIGNSGINTGGGSHDTIQANIIFACGRKDAGPRSNAGIRIRDDGGGTYTTRDVMVIGNRVYEDDTTHALDAGALGQLYGIEIVDASGGGSPNDLVIKDNDFRVVDAAPGGWTPILRTDVGPNAIVRDNLVDSLDTAEGLTVRTSTFVVAANDAPQSSKDGADWVCDGTADDVQIQAAIDALPSGGGQVSLSDGIFNIAATVVLDKNYISLVGSGWSTILRAVNSLNSPIIATTQPAAAQRLGIRIIWMKIDGNKANQTSGGAINLVGTYFALLSHLWIVDSEDYGIQIIRNSGSDPFAAYNFIENCHITLGDGFGIHTTATSDYNFIKHSVIDWHNQVGGVGVKLEGWNQKVMNCVFDSNETGLHIPFARQNLIQGNSFDRSDIRHLWIEGQGSNIVDGNTFLSRDAGGSGTAQVDSTNASESNVFTANIFVASDFTNSVNEDSGGPNVYVANDFEEQPSLQSNAILTGNARYLIDVGHESALAMGQAGDIPAATTDDTADFYVTVPFDMTLLRLVGVVKTKPTSDTTIQIRRSTDDGNSFSNAFGTVVITAAGSAKSFSSDPTDLDVDEGDVMNYSITVGGGDGTNLLVETIGVAR
jgi:hypothetical protein